MRNTIGLALTLALTLPAVACDLGGGSNDETTTSATATGGATGDPTGDPTMGSGADETSTPDSGGPSGGFCVHQCEVDGDCTVAGADIGLTCTDGFCQGEGGKVETCSDDEACIAQLSGWEFGAACTAGGGECEPSMGACLDVGGEGHCALAPSEFFACADSGFDEIQTTDIDGAMVTVCGDSNAACGDDGFCFSPCAEDADCAAPSATTCNTNTGFCECASDDDCATLESSNLSSCNAGVCGCGEDQDCVDGGAGDVCNSGSCGCSGDAACGDVVNSFDGGMINCVEL